ncbi:hypothetical protein EGR_10713 [Echinococcus granulosus]|uniref:Uncharacterized protein n=1 Tax=Echinococcus granulosus TaxID=6210 RepID=W6U1K4_ECHGR|nr:hypothetical protein EGR_10713 [Echinococcus granulosus]EUB54426.1 hypothetical protein EGR_10713 [Echinococcus granulosus]
MYGAWECGGATRESTPERMIREDCVYQRTLLQDCKYFTNRTVAKKGKLTQHKPEIALRKRIYAPTISKVVFESGCVVYQGSDKFHANAEVIHSLLFLSDFCSSNCITL